MRTSDARSDCSTDAFNLDTLSCQPHPVPPGFLAGVGVGVSATLSVGALMLLFFLGFGVFARHGIASDRLASGFAAQEDVGAGGRTERPQRPIGDIRRDAKAFIKRSKEDDPVASTGAIVDLCILHQEIVRDPRFQTHDVLISMRAQIAARLKQFKKQLTLDMKRRERSMAREQQQARRSAASRESTPTNSRSTASSNAAGESDATGDTALLSGGTSSEFDADATLTDAMIRDAEMLTGMTGGPIRIWGHVGGNFAPPWDHGPELVNLIESTINPEFWRRNGGNGVIEYYQPLRVLVISASSQVHDDITNMLRILRDTSR